ncbi:unnamed protein product, partial [Candidula unifasciata]
RRPSFPQGAVDWRSRHKVVPEGKKRQGRRKPISACFLPESEEDGQNDLSPERMSWHERSCPFYESDKERSHHLTADNNSIDSNKKRYSDNVAAPASDLFNEPSLSSSLSIVECNCRLQKSDTLQNNNNIDEGGDNRDEAHKYNDEECVRNRKPKRKKNRNIRETVIINVGGQIFETYKSTLTRLRTPVFHSDTLELYYRKSHKDYFFDRDPSAFGSILNFLRTGELHIPTNMCGPALQNELAFWGIEETDISRCCWTQYNTWKTQCRSLEKLENDRKFSTTQETEQVDPNDSCWNRCKSKIWTFLQDPGSSKKAKAYAWVSIIFVFVSIFSFCAETHPMFKVKARDMTHFASFYEFFNVQSIPWAQVLSAVRHNATVHAETTPQPRPDAFASSTNSTKLNMTKQRASGIAKRSLSKHACETRASFEGNKNNNDNDSDWGNRDLPHPTLIVMDAICLFFFTLEYITRFVCTPSKLNFLRALQNIVDFLAFAPDYVELLFLIIDPSQKEGVAIMEMLFILRILRLFRIFRLIRHVPGLWILLYTLKASFNELMLMCVFLLIGMVVFATLVHFVEPDGTFNNIPVGFWWSVVTMTTVGYGDMYPQSAAGYVIGSCCAVAGLLMIAFTVPIIVSNFVLYYTHVQYGLARRDRENDREKEEGEIELLKCINRNDVEKIGSLLSLTSRRKSQKIAKSPATTTKNGKSYTPVSTKSDTENAAGASRDSIEKNLCEHTTVIEMGEKVV